ncbi:DUF724 domain-containing protein 3-like isoform X2 [Momordica charantia]|uniref:DUF724 domain-containing protein 3-like isoform X2 n=1 Tax=Momordica charantia TaxID=3673 RepID=A0A6J1D0U3_MOMCH|nr:DUF724 domain-containing protein 3-like isoform X2 [Momordica charantia]
MGGFDSPSSHTQQQHDHHHQPFTIGSEIEVSIDEDGFKGALFRATILKLPTSPFSQSKKKKALVEYKTLVTENGSTPLKEQVDALSLRPLPPDSSLKDFEEGDIVDAVDKDGWWTGVVCKVLEDGGYSVFFKNPLHVMDFQRNQLRLHQDWVDGNWVVPPKMDASILTDQLQRCSKGADIIENDRSESLKNAETKIEKENSYSINSRNNLMEQPSICDENSASLALTLRRRRRSISCKSRVSSLKKIGESNSPGAPAAYGLRKTDSRVLRGKSRCRKATWNSGGRKRGYQSFRCDDDSSSNSPDEFESPEGGEKVRTKEDVDGSGELKEQGSRVINGKKRNTLAQSQSTQVTDKEGKDDCDVSEIIPKEVSTRNESERNKQLASKEKWMTPKKNSLHLPDEVRGVEEDSNNQTKEKSMEPEQQAATKFSDKRKRGRPARLMQEPEQQQSSKNSYKRKRGRPRKLMLVPTSAKGKEQDGTGRNPDKAIRTSCVTDLQDLNGENWNELSMHKTKGVENKSASSNIDDDDRPLLMWLGGMQSSGTINSLRQTPDSTAKRRTKGCEQVDVLNEVKIVDATPDCATTTKQDWPFAKKSPVWNAIDSLEVFTQIPQTPHFHPLSTYKEECREGLAIGCMVTFASLVEKISKLQFDNPRHVFESMLASLYDLEQHGFNISTLCNRANELLFIKDSQARYEEETKEAENKVLEHTQRKSKLAEEIKDIEQKITELQERRASIRTEMKSKDHEIAMLQSHVEAIRECTENTRLHFDKQVALPLKPV